MYYLTQNQNVLNSNNINNFLNDVASTLGNTIDQCWSTNGCTLTMLNVSFYFSQSQH